MERNDGRWRAEEEGWAAPRESGVGDAGLRHASLPPHSTTLARWLRGLERGDADVVDGDEDGGAFCIAAEGEGFGEDVLEHYVKAVPVLCWANEGTDWREQRFKHRER